MIVSITSEGSVAVVTIDNPPVNAASAAVRQGLVAAVKSTDADPSVEAVVLICAGRTFVAGADVREFGKPTQDPILPDVVTTLENAEKPWVAAIHGSALGGGLEIALGCSYRVASTSAKFGLPEVNLGLIPGAGATVRLPRLIAAENALEMMASGKPINAKKAVELGLADAVTSDPLRDAAISFGRDRAGQATPAPISKRPLRSYDSKALQNQISKVTAKARGQNSPIAICEAVENTITMPVEGAFAAERAIFLRLKDDPQSLALRHIFFAERAAAKIDGLEGVKPAPMNTVGIVGGGTMGAGIAAACLLADLSVIMIERDQNALDVGMQQTHKIIEGSRKRGLISQAKEQTIHASFSGSTTYSVLNQANLVIEAVFEEMSVKHDVFKHLATAAGPDTILASNTSYLDVGQIAEAVPNPSRVIGLHFFSPAHIMKLLELVIPAGASSVAIATGAALGKRLRKIVVPSGVCDGFIGNRMMSAYRKVCDGMIEDGALPQQVDAAMRSFGFPMGIYEMQDLAGLDISWAMRKRKAATRDPSERYVDIADKLCEQGRFGRKTGRGWYVYADGKKSVDPEVEALILDTSERKNINRCDFSEDEIMSEILSAMETEGHAILAEGIAANSSDIDVVMVNGYGFPRWQGGPMYLGMRS